MTRENDYNTNLITAEGIQALLDYIPYFESEHNFGDYAEVEEGCIGCSILAEKASAFMHDCYDHHFVQDFDWPAWVDQNQTLARKGEGIETVDLETIGKLLTAHCRGDRFCDGHLLSVMENGQVLRILKRLETFMSNFNMKIKNR